MIDQVVIENFKSIERAEIELGQFNVLIGENGSGKSNILEAIAVGSAASQNLLSNEFLASRGIRWAPSFMRPAFDGRPSGELSIGFKANNLDLDYKLEPSTDPSDSDVGIRWVTAEAPLSSDELREAISDVYNAGLESRGGEEFTKGIYLLANLLYGSSRRVSSRSQGRDISDFLIYSPENTALRVFQEEGQILPLGIKGEGLFGYLKHISNTESGAAFIAQIAEDLRIIGWFDDLSIPQDLAPGERRIEIVDRFFEASARRFDQRTANEGFLLLLFYFTLMRSKDTPRFFAIDNVDASLNPKLCTELTKKLVQLAKENDRQVIATTHNPAILDGLDLNDENQRLMVVSRTSSGRTRLTRVKAPRGNRKGRMRLSEAFTRGLLGGLPKGF